MSVLGTVAELHRYPVKSMLGEEIPSCHVSDTGFESDRKFALIDRETGKVVSAKRPKLWRAMLSMSATALDGVVRISLPDGSRHPADDPGLDQKLSAVLGREVTLADTPPLDARLERSVPEDVLRDGVITDVDAEILTLATGAPAGTFFDFAPVHLITTATVRRIGGLSSRGSVEAVRYRPNLILDTDADAFTENEWVNRDLIIGDEVVLRVITPSPRCAVPTLEHGTLPRNAEALTVVAEHNRIEPLAGADAQACAGAYARVIQNGRIRADDPIRF